MTTSIELGGQTVTCRAFDGARSDAAAREIIVALETITSNRAGASASIAARAANHAALLRLAGTLVDPDYVTFTPAGSDAAQPLTPAAAEQLLAPNDLVLLLAWIVRSEFLLGSLD